MASSMNSRTFLLLASLFALLFLQACKTQRAIIKEPIKEQGEAFLLQKMQENQMEFEWLSARANIQLEHQGHRHDFRARFRIKKDSIIWLSLSPALGLEMVRIKISTDSIRFMNRMDRTYFEGDYQLITHLLQTTIEFDMLQSLLIGNDFSFYDNSTFRASVDDGMYRLSTSGRTRLKRYLKQDDTPNIFIQNIWLHPGHFKITRVNMKELADDNIRLQVSYSDFTEAGDQLFPSRIQFEVKGGNRSGMMIEFSRIELDQPQTFPWRVPDNFKKIE